MAEENKASIQVAPAEEAAVQAAPVQTVPVREAARPEDAGPSRKGSPLLVFLTVLLILIGIADVILWGVVGYYFLQGSWSRDTEAAQTALTGGEAASGGAEGQDPLAVYIQEMQEIWERHDEERDYYNSIKEMDEDTFYAELTQRTTPAYRQIFEDAAKVTSEDPEVEKLCEMFQKFGVKRLGDCEAQTSAIEDQSWISQIKTNLSIAATNHYRNSYWKAVRKLAEERGIPFDR